MATPPKVNRWLEVLYEDEQYMVFDKPQGILVIPSPKGETYTLTSEANKQYATPESGNLHPCHRLDRDTSGVIIYAKGKKNQQLMMDQFKHQSVKKKYLAIVHGRMPMKVGELRSNIVDKEEERYHKVSTPKLAITRFNVLESKKGFSLVEVQPITGRTNQIRIQFSQKGCPLLGERKYAFARDFETKFKRMALHAKEIYCMNPITKNKISVQSPTPKDMEAFLERNGYQKQNYK